MSDINIEIARKLKKINDELDVLRTIEVPGISGTGATFLEGPDIDLVSAGGTLTIGRAGDSILLYHANGNPVSEFAATEAGLIAALAAAAADDIVHLPLITITLTAPITIPAGVRVKGNSLASFDSPIVQAIADVGTPLVTLGAGAMLEALEINYSGANNVAQRVAVLAGANTFIRQVWSYCTNATGDALGIYLQGVGAYASLAAGVASGGGAGIGRGILLSGASSYTYLCTGTGNGAAGSTGIEVRDTGLVWDCRGLSTGGWGLLVSTNGGASTSKVIGGIYTGSVADIRIDALCTLQAYGIQYTTSSVVGTLTYLPGDRAAYSVEDYHATDIEAAALTRHNATPGTVGNVMRDNGTNWISVAAASYLPFAPTARGDLIAANVTPAWARLALGGITGSIVTRDATDVLWSTFALAGTAAQTYTFPAVGGAVPVGTGVVGRVAEWVTNANTLQAANLIAPVANILTLTATAASTLALAITAGKTLTLTAIDNYNLTVPATGTAVLGGAGGHADRFAVWSDTNTVGHYDGLGLVSSIVYLGYPVALGGALWQHIANGSGILAGGPNCEIGASASYTVALGYRAKAVHDSVFVWADYVAADFSSIIANEVAFRARGGFRHAYDDTHYWMASVASTGITTFDIVGDASEKFIFTPPVTFSAAITANGGIVMADGATIGQAAGPLIAFDDTNSYLEITGCTVGVGTITPLAIGADVRTIDIRSNGHLASSGGGVSFGWDSAQKGAIYTYGSDLYLGATAGYTIITGGNFGIGDTAPGDTCVIKQASTTAAISVLQLNQLDVDQPFINFQGGTVYTGKTAADEYLTVKVGAGTRYIRLYT